MVQGVGFRPFIHKLAKEYALSGWIRNTISGVVLETEGEAEKVDAFGAALAAHPPKLAVIVSIEQEERTPSDEDGAAFVILPSEDGAGNQTLVSPDLGICEDCRRELLDPADRRYRYPFLNCTNCGPRFTILKRVPYDRDHTSMADFPMCPACEREYQEIENRRYHAQPNCCPVCGPELTFLEGDGTPVTCDPLAEAKRRLKEGQILAVKGLGGFHLACLPERAEELRRRKHRDEKPFALMCRNLAAAEELAEISAEERQILTGFRKPIVLLKKREQARHRLAGVSENGYVGIMLPYTPLHVLLMEPEFDSLILTSANLSDSPIMFRNAEAGKELNGIADGFLVHNRRIETRCDDSLVWVVEGKEYFVRRSRGYAPFPIYRKTPLAPILACGAEQKASFALSKGCCVFLSQHIGDLKNMETLAHYEEQEAHFETLFAIRPQAVVCDRHPDYLSTDFAERLAGERGIPLIRVQHHHAHMVSCLADRELEGPCIGVIWDGTGLGEPIPGKTGAAGAPVWGAEFLTGDASGYQRRGTIRPIALAGGYAAVREIGRIGLALLWDAGLVKPEERAGREAAVLRMLASGRQVTEATSMGRLFDGIYALLKGRNVVSYEGQGAVLLEAEAEEGCEETYPWQIEEEEDLLVFDYREMVRELRKEIGDGGAPGRAAAKFMNTLTAMAEEMCCRIRKKTGLNRVVLSGGVFQNQYLLVRMKAGLEKAGFETYTHQRVSANDEGISLGQMMIAEKRLYHVSGSAISDC